MKQCVALFALLVAGIPALFAGPNVPSSLAIDFRAPAWSGAHNAPSFSVGPISALPAGPGDSVKLRQNASDGLGVDSSALFEDPNEVGPRESLTISFGGASGQDLTGAWLTRLFDELINDRGSVSLYGAGNVFLTSLSFSGASSLAGDFFIDFGTSYSLTSAVFTADGTVLGNRDYAVAGFTRAESVPDSGASIVLFGLGVMGLLAIQGTRRHA